MRLTLKTTSINRACTKQLMRQNDTEMQFYLFIYFFNISDFSSNYTRFISISNKNV